MIKIEIKNRWTGEILFEFAKENNTIKSTLLEAIKSGSDLRGSNLSGSDLSGSDLSGSDLSDSDLRDSDLSGSNLRGSDLRGSDLRGSDLSDSNLSGSDLRDSDLSGSDLRGSDLSDSNLSGSDLRDSDLRDSDLSGSNLRGIRNDFWAKLLILKSEIPAFKEKIIAGQIDGSCYEGACCCFVGTFANIKNVNYKKLEGVYPDSGSPTEKWFLGFKEGDTPENSQIAKITMEWIEEFELHLNK